MIRFLIRTVIYFVSALIGIIAADLILSGSTVSGWTSYVVVAIVFALIQAILSPLLGQMAERNASAFMGGIGLISAFVALFITNLLLNSLDALDESTGENRKIFIQASQIEDGMIQIVLSDNGTGIEPEKLPHLFEPFFTTREDGMGIGLAISKTIVETHGGKITAENSPRGGTVVRFTLKAGRSVETQA